jgi:hypothetical protein
LVMVIVHSHNGVPIRLTAERWQHIGRRHPEMETLKQQVLETVTTPDLVQEGDQGELLAIRDVPKTPLTHKYLVVVYREMDAQDGFILTAYLTSRPSAGRNSVWKR